MGLLSTPELARRAWPHLPDLLAALEERFPAALSAGGLSGTMEVREAAALPEIGRFLFWEAGCSFGGLVVEECGPTWTLNYLFLLPEAGWIRLERRQPLEDDTVPSISAQVHAADWYEREAEDLFGLRFAQHPRLGDFVLHDQVWREGVAPMRKRFDANQSEAETKPRRDWHPHLVVQDPGAFAMPVGPVYEGGMGESVHFLLETVGEDVIRAAPRLFYKYRAVEKIAEGRTVDEGLLLAERFAATSAFAHGLAYCQAVEAAAGVQAPARARRLRVALAELERLRHHAGAIEWICRSTALNVAEAQAAQIEEQLLRASGEFSGHRYLFGLNTPGGLRRDFEREACNRLVDRVAGAAVDLLQLQERLLYSSSFLDRLEEAGVVSRESARDLDLVGPVGRASGLRQDLRRACPYGGYEQWPWREAQEQEGDGFARLRVLFSEALASAGLIAQVLAELPGGELRAACAPTPGSTLGWVEAPTGAALHWLRLDREGRIERYRILSPSFRNWLGFHVAVENFAFQDFPIILATFALSAAECDR